MPNYSFILIFFSNNWHTYDYDDAWHTQNLWIFKHTLTNIEKRQSGLNKSVVARHVKLQCHFFLLNKLFLLLKHYKRYTFDFVEHFSICYIQLKCFNFGIFLSNTYLLFIHAVCDKNPNLWCICLSKKCVFLTTIKFLLMSVNYSLFPTKTLVDIKCKDSFITVEGWSFVIAFSLPVCLQR